MKKRIAYIGISYPLLYDYRYQASKTFNDTWDSPNPIIESPLGLMVLYDELLFLCRSICPDNMRNLPYVKFVDELYPEFSFKNSWKEATEIKDMLTIDYNMSFSDIKKALNIKWDGVDEHTHRLRIGDINLAAMSNEREFLFDIYVFKELQNIYGSNIELITNSRYASNEDKGGVEAEYVEKIIIPGIPNYIGIAGPYHDCIEELRENKYLRDFRRWVIENHKNMQRTEIAEMCVAVEKNIEEVKEAVFKKYLEDNSQYSFFKSTATTVMKTTLGLICSPVSIVDALAGSVIKGKETLDAQSLRWQGFVIESRDIVKNMR